MPPPVSVAPIATSDGVRRAYLGTFAAPRMRLELAAKGTALAGTLTLKGTPFPASARVVDEALTGTFLARKQPHPFTARLVSRDALALRCDGRSYRLRRLGALASGARLPGGVSPVGPAPPPSLRPPWAGRFRGKLEGRAATLTLHQTATDLRGELRAKGYRFTLKGRVESKARARGSMRDPMTGESRGFVASQAGKRVTLLVRLIDPKSRRASLQTLYFDRAR